MAGDKSKKPSRKTQTTKNKRKKTPTRADKEPTKTATNTGGGGGGFQRLDLDKANAGMERLPSNAPTMAIAPSDYEHIFHEGAGAAPASPAQPSPPAPPAPGAEPERTRGPARSPQQDYAGPQSPQPMAPPVPSAGQEVQVTPDGYTLLGQPQLDMSSNATRRVAFPSHIVRANNQFSRAALARVARYLASRSEF